MTFHCRKCGLTREVKARHAGKSVACPRCKQVVRLPAAPLPSASLVKVRGSLRRSLFFALCLVFLLAAVFVFLKQGSQTSRQSAPNQITTFTAKKGDLTINVIEAGTIKARDQEIIKSEVEGVNTILWIIDEGKQVKKGDLLLEIDASKLEEKLVDQQIKVQNNEAAYVRATENLLVTKNQSASDIDKAELTLSFARQDLQKYSEGEYPKELKEAQARITLAQEELSRAADKLRWSKKLFGEKYLSQTELQADELAASKAQLNVELAEESLNLLRDYTYARTMSELENGVKQAEMALERAKLKGSSDIVQAEASLRAAESEFKREQGKLEKILLQLEKTKIYAPADGLVVYATTAKGSWRGNTEPLAAGQEVKERQELIYLPQTNSVLVEAKIHESSLDKVRIGLPAQITVDALAGRSFTGKVASISPLPDATSMWFNPDLKLYNTVIFLEGDAGSLRTGMSCQAEIIVARYSDVIAIPLQAVVQVDGKPAVYVRQGKQIAARQVEIGQDNNRMIHIISGLQGGEEVVLTPTHLSSQRRPSAQAR